ncbi:uncharacterized protein LOC143145854 isoform X3 [Ptiloglossa arizonensis]
MFYSSELLSLRRKGKLARCWLAATISEKMFRQTFKPGSITKIDVTVICKEILTFAIQNGRNYDRFSLYLSSQLMYGATKILSYQTKLFEDYLFTINWKMGKMNRRKFEFNLAIALRELEDPPVIEVFRDVERPLNLHLITERPYTSIIEHLIQDEMNFGVLTDSEMEKFMLPEAEEQCLNEIRKFHWNESEDIIEECVQIPLVDLNGFEIDIVESEIETREVFTKEDQRESLLINEDHQLKKPAAVTPKKRTTKSLIETPKKRRKVSSEEVPASQSISADVPPLPPPEILALPLAEIHALEFADVTAQVLASVNSSEFEPQQRSAFKNVQLTEIIIPRRRKKLFDKQTGLSSNVMRNWIKNVAAHTVEHCSFTATLPSAKEYLTQPTLKNLGTSWAEPLMKLFRHYLTGPFFAQNEFLDFETDQVKFKETIRPDTSSKLHGQIGELSSKIAITTTTETSDYSKTIEKILPIDHYRAKIPEEQQRKQIEESLVELPEITNIEEKIRQTSNTEMLEKQLNERKRRLSTSSFSSCSRIHLIKAEVLALLEIHWYQGNLVKFQDLITLDYNKLDASCAFQYCLEFHAENVLILKQDQPFHTIWIEKYPYYSSKNGEDNVVDAITTSSQQLHM